VYWQASVRESLERIEKAGVTIVRDVDHDAFRRQAETMYADPEYQVPEIRDLVERIRALGRPESAP
jgi:TRAP-type C4-dicarboxylate transport system substrate-binding protein